MTTNARLLKADAALVRNQSPVTVGTIFKGWRGTKGIDYIVTGINTTAKEIYAVKHNAINEDGTVHASVTRHKRTLKYTETPSGAFGGLEQPDKIPITNNETNNKINLLLILKNSY